MKETIVYSRDCEARLNIIAHYLFNGGFSLPPRLYAEGGSPPP
jgi:hypothetical protein